MATITSVNNTTVGATYNIHDTTTWIGGVVPGPNDTVVFQSATATTWFLTQNWTIQGITWSASTNRSESGIEVPNTVSQDITFTQTSTSWYGNATPMQISTETRVKPWLKIVNPIGTTFTLNLPGNLGLEGNTSALENTTKIIEIAQAGTANLNITGVIVGSRVAHSQGGDSARNAILINASSGYTEINCATLLGGGNSLTNATWVSRNSPAIYINGLSSGGSVEINCSNIAINYYNTGGSIVHNSPAIITAGNLQNGVTLNVTGDILYARADRGNLWIRHTAGTFTVNANQITATTENLTQGYNEAWNAGTLGGVRYNVYCDANNVNSVTIFDCDIQGPNNINNTISTLNHSWITTGACTHKFYGNIYTSNLNRYQTPFYYDNDNVLWYHMAGTIFNSISSAVYHTRVAFIAFTGGFYHANVVQSNDPVNLYSPNKCPFIVSCLMPNPNYTGGTQMSWTFVKGADNRAETSTMILGDFVGYSPIESNVRLGTVYGNGTKTGTLAVPPPYNVTLGIPTDNTVGTLVSEITVIDVPGIVAQVWNYDLTQITNTTNGPGQRLLNNATIESTGEQIAALGV
jgi:hypothetical protein